MAKLYDLARMTTATGGTGTITLGSAVSGFLSFSGAGVADGDVVSYGIKDGANSEVGTGTYTASGTTLTRTVTKSTNSNTAISLSGTAEVYITLRAEDIVTSAADKTAISNVSGSTGAPAANNLATIGSSLVLLATQTTAGAATIDFTSSINSSYSEYLFVLSPVYSVTDAVTLQMQLSSDGGSSWLAAGYDYALMLMGSGSATPAGAAAESAAAINLTDATISNIAQRLIAGEVRLFSPSDATRHPINVDLSHWTSAGHLQRVAGAAIYQGGNVAINGVRFKMSSGNIIGTIYMYGVRPS
jgi:hypothetical protein